MKKRMFSSLIAFVSVFAVYYIADYLFKGVFSSGIVGDVIWMIVIITAVVFSDFLYKKMKK